MKMMPCPVGLPSSHLILLLGTGIFVPFGISPLPSVMTATLEAEHPASDEPTILLVARLNGYHGSHRPIA
jgi:hypothetical protein